MQIPTQQPFRAKAILLSTTKIPMEVYEELSREWDDATKNIPNLVTEPLFIGENVPVPDIAGMRYWDAEKNRAQMRHSWFEENITNKLNVKERNIVVWHITPEQRTAWGLPETLNGVYWKDNNDVLEAYICCAPNEVAKARYATRGLLEIIRLFLHEAGHGLTHFSGRRDELRASMGITNPKELPVHHADYVLKDVRQVYRHMDFTRWSLNRFLLSLLLYIIPLMKQVSEKEKGVVEIVNPLAAFPMSQEYGIHKPEWYPLTEHHIGCDYATPMGTQLKAWIDGEVVSAGFSNTLGYFCEFRYTHNKIKYAARFLHLQGLPHRGVRKAGETIGTTGQSGFVTGPHCHIDVWFDQVQIADINKDNWQELTIDPEKHFLG